MIDPSDVIYSYTAQDGLNDGTLVDAATHTNLYLVTAELFRGQCRVLLTAGLLEEINQAALRHPTASPMVGFYWRKIVVEFVRAHRYNHYSSAFVTTFLGLTPITYKIVIGAFGPNDPTALLTFCLPNED